MIVGIGCDVVNIQRIERALARFGQRFIDRVFAPDERLSGRDGHDDPGACAYRSKYYARRFAAKEACAKAMGLGIGTLAWREMVVRNNANGAPALSLMGNARARLEVLGGQAVHLSLSDDPPVAMAVVVIAGEG
ncbi:MAG: holo-ACP synthase [Pseudomonadota bacterium]